MPLLRWLESLKASIFIDDQLHRSFYTVVSETLENFPIISEELEIFCDLLYWFYFAVGQQLLTTDLKSHALLNEKLKHKVTKERNVIEFAVDGK